MRQTHTGLSGDSMCPGETTLWEGEEEGKGGRRFQAQRTGAQPQQRHVLAVFKGQEKASGL